MPALAFNVLESAPLICSSVARRSCSFDGVSVVLRARVAGFVVIRGYQTKLSVDLDAAFQFSMADGSTSTDIRARSKIFTSAKRQRSLRTDVKSRCIGRTKQNCLFLQYDNSGDRLGRAHLTHCRCSDLHAEDDGDSSEGIRPCCYAST